MGGLPGGLFSVPVDAEIETLAARASQSLLIGASAVIASSTCYEVSLVEVVTATRQVVQGTNFRLGLRVAVTTGPDCQGRAERTCTGVVVHRPLSCREANFASCLQLLEEENIVCRQFLTSTPRSIVPSVDSPCSLPMKLGPCRSLRPRVFYNSVTKQCEQFLYSGCRGNANNWASVGECEAQCGAEGVRHTEPRCVVGNTTYALGDVVRLRTGGDACRSCSCSSPPHLTCYDKVCPSIAFKPPLGCVNPVIERDAMGCCDVGIRCESVTPPRPPSIGGGMLGGFRQEQLSGETKLIAAHTTRNLLSDLPWLKNSCDHLVLLEVLEVHRQVVAGTKFRLKLRLRTKAGPECVETEEKECEDIVVFRPLPHVCGGQDPGACLTLAQPEGIRCTLGY